MPVGGGNRRELPMWLWGVLGLGALGLGAYGGTWIAPVANGFIDLFAAIFHVFGRFLQ